MTEPRLKTEIWVKAQIRQCDVDFIPAVVARRGDADSGQVLIKRNCLDGGFEVFARTIAPDGGSGWRRLTGPVPVDETAAQAAIDRETGFDPDLWVVEIEDSEGRYRLDGPVV